MKNHLGLVILAAVVLVALIGQTVLYENDALRDVVLIKTFGRVTDVQWGREREQAGLHAKWPWPVQQVVRYDARSKIFEDINVEYQTKDKQNLIVSVYCTWQIEDPVRFHTAVETEADARTKLKDRLRHYKGEVLGRHEMRDFVNTDPRGMLLDEIEQEILQPLRKEVAADYGIAVLEVGFKAIALPESVSQAVIEQQKEEREKEVKDLQAQGEAIAQAIVARAESARDTILAFAERKRSDIETKGVYEAARYYEDFQQAPELAVFLREMESLRKQLEKNTVFVLDGSLLRAVEYFRRAPQEVLQQSRPGNAGPSVVNRTADTAPQTSAADER